MPEWLYEPGIGENRAALIEHGEIVEAAIELDDGLPPVDTVATARLIARDQVRLATGHDAQLIRPANFPEGATLTVRIVREAIPEPGGRTKPARAAATSEPLRPGPDLLARLQLDASPQVPSRRTPGARAQNDSPGDPGPRRSPGRETHHIRTFHPHQPDALEAAGWSELLEEARTGDIAFPGGSLRMWLTPAMTLFDVDGGGPLDTLALAAARAVGAAIRRHGIGGSIGIDFPTLAGKAARQAVGEALDQALAWDTAFERTAMNGFGFLQIVRPRLRASIPELLHADPLGAAARALLRRLEREPPSPPRGHRVDAAVLARIPPAWLAELARRTGVVPRLES